jgi:FAD/FMN-containing dehydrogenase
MTRSTTRMPTADLPYVELHEGFDGQILLPSDDGYDDARRVWNAMIDRRPAIIARCASERDVAASIRFARRHELEIGVRGGGHSVVGHAVPEGGLMLDLSPMGAVRVDPDRRRAWVQGGALLGDLDRVAQRHGLATTAGNVSLTGVGGLTLGGGMGWLARQLGLACDNVVSARVVSADGELLTASETEHSDLYWGLRGGGGNFGVATEFEFRLHAIDTRSLMVDLWYPLADGPAVLRAFRRLAAEAPEQATLTCWVGTAGEWPFLPAELHGRDLVSAGFVWVGDPEPGRELIGSLRAAASPARPVAEAISEVSYLELQSGSDENHRPGTRRYWKGHYLPALEDAAIDALLSRGGPAPEGGLVGNGGLQAYGGAIARVGDEETAFDHRSTAFELVIVTSWTDPGEDEARMAASRRFAAAVEPYARGVYVNSLADEGDRGVRAAYGDKLARLAALKQRYDPDNVFHLNHNIRPSGG